MNLKLAEGKVPIRSKGETLYLLVDFPSKEDFYRLYAKHKSKDLKDKYWTILNSRAQGLTLADAGKPFGLTRERVRQIEARFQRLVGEDFHKV